MSNIQPQCSTKKLNLAERLQIIELLKFSKFSQSQIAKQFGCSKSQITTILENREHYFQLQQQQQTLGVSTTTSTTSSTSTAKDAGLNLQIPQTKRILSLAEQCQIVELRKTSDITHKALAKQFGCGISKIRTTLNNSEYYLKLQLRRNETLATLNEIPSTSTQQQTLGASTTTSTFRRIVHSVSLLLH